MKSIKNTVKKALKITGLIILALIAAFLIWLTIATIQYYPTAGALENIKNTRLTMQDVTGETLPAKRTKAEYDATVQGLDENNNGIRDDVEHAILEMTSDSLQMRAAKLQYAQALQLYFSSVRDGETLTEVVYKSGFGYGCILDELSEENPGIKNLGLRIERISLITSELEKLILNTTSRDKEYSSKDKFNVTLLNPPDEGCHVIIEE